ncbi:MAG: helix-turn-helix domain-containing protein [Candidatus Omnitrophota bacterium]
MIQEVMTTEQLAKYLQLDEQTIYRKARAGQIPAVHIGKTLRFKKEVIDGWLRISSLRWTAKKRQSLRGWAEEFAKEKGLKEEDLEKAISKRRYH